MAAFGTLKCFAEQNISQIFTTGQHMNIKKLIVSKKLLISAIAVFALIAIGFLGQKQIGKFLSSGKESLLSKIAPSSEEEQTETTEITLPQASDEGFTLEEELKKGAESEAKTASSLEVITPKKVSPLGEISKKVDEISGKVQVFSQKVNDLAESRGIVMGESTSEESKETRLAEIRAQIDEISVKVQSLSQKVSELTNASKQGV